MGVQQGCFLVGALYYHLPELVMNNDRIYCACETNLWIQGVPQSPYRTDSIKRFFLFPLCYNKTTISTPNTQNKEKRNEAPLLTRSSVEIVTFGLQV